jgi:simple sugar transport system substrate-binding protein
MRQAVPVKAGRPALAEVLVLICGLAMAACARTESGPAEVRYLIGVSQANLSEPWRIAMCDDIKAEAAKHPDLRVIFADAADSAEKQIQDVRRLMDYGVDLLIISEIDSTALTPVVEQAYRSIPVILLDRAVEGYDYTLFIGPDNEQIGREAGRYVAELLGERGGSVLEIQGRSGSPPALDRSNGFREVLSGRPGIRLLEPVAADWLRDRAEDEFLKRASDYPRIDVVFAQNDSMAYGAALAAQRVGMQGIKIIGTDGFPGPNGGLDLLRRGMLAATFICPTGGTAAIEYGIDILDRREGIPKKILLRTRKVTTADLEPSGVTAPYVQASSKPTGRRLVLGFAQVGHESHWRMTNTASVKEAVAKAGFELRFVDCENLVEKQVEAIDSFIRDRVDVIAFSPIVESGMEPVLRRAKAAGIPVVLIDRAVDTKDDSLWVTFVGSDFLEEGRRAGRWLAERLGERPARIVEIQGTLGSAPALDRKEGFEEILAQHPNLTLISSVVSDFTPEGGKAAMQRILSSVFGPIHAVFAHNDEMAFGAIEALEEAGLKPGKEVIIVSVDAGRKAFEAMIAGKLNCTVECTPLLGPQLVKAVQDYMAGKSMPIRIITDEAVFPAEIAKEVLPKRKY